MNQEAFWHLTLGEIRTYVKLSADNRKAEFKQQLLLRNFEAVRTAEYVSCIFSKDSQIGSYYDMFPELFKEEIQADLDRQTEENKANFMAYSMAHNQEYESEGGEIDG